MAETFSEYKALFHSSPNAYVLFTPDLTVADVNASHMALIGYRREDLVGKNLFEAFPVEDETLKARLRDSFQRVLDTGDEDTQVFRHPRVERETARQVRYWHINNRPLFDESGQLVFILNFVTDLSDLLLRQQSNGSRPHQPAFKPNSATVVSEEPRRLRSLMEQAPGFVAVGRGPNFVFELANNAYYELVGHRDILGKPIRKALPELEGQGFYELLDQVYRTGEAFVGRAMPVQVRQSRGAPLVERYIDFIYQPILEADNQVTGIFVQGHDVTEAQELSRQLSHQAAHDALTGLCNRHEFEQRLQRALRGLSDGGVHSLLYLDLDQFKLLNDTCGHQAGDEFLRLVSLVLSARVRPSDTLARLGGDEFGLLLEGCPAHAAARIAEQLRKSINDLEFIWKHRVFGGSVSIGLVTVSEQSREFGNPLSAADSACFLAKEKGRNRVQEYRPEDDELVSRWHEMDAIGRLRRALKEDSFELHWQKIQPLAEMGPMPDHYEVLIRLRRGDELVSPMEFIPAAERYGLMPAIDRHVVRKVFSYLADRPDLVCSLSVNLSGATLNDETFAPFIGEMLARYAIDAALVCFEITETSAVANLGKTSDLIRQLKESGFRFALDDFGCGMSSFAYLKHLPVDYLKIDGVFVRRILEDQIDSAMVEAIARVAKVMGIRTVAEYVENEDIRALLTRLGVDFGQGHGIHRPEPFC